jgi:hypothetical protein
MAVHSGTAYPYSTTYLVTQLSKGAPPPVAHTCRAFYTPSVWLALYNLLVATEFVVMLPPLVASRSSSRRQGGTTLVPVRESADTCGGLEAL